MSLDVTFGHAVFETHFANNPQTASESNTILAWTDGEMVDIFCIEAVPNSYFLAGELVRKQGRPADVLITSEPVELPNGDLGRIGVISVAGNDGSMGLWPASKKTTLEEALQCSAEEAEEMVVEFVMENLATMHLLWKASFAA